MHNNLEWTGERLVTSKTGDIVELHLHRYAIAIEYVQGKTVLDIASGEGYGSNLLSQKALKVTGVDICQEAVDFANAKYGHKNLTFIQGAADQIPLSDHSVDVVVSFETIEHHDKHEEMMQEIKRVLVHDGVLIISSPDKLNYSDIPKVKNPFHVKELYKDEFKLLIGKYFNYYSLYNQRMYFGSLLIHEHGKNETFKEYNGDFNHIESTIGVKDSVYLIAVATDKGIDAFKDGNSIFNANYLHKDIEVVEKETRQLVSDEIYSSKSYRFANILLFPYRILNKLWKK